MWGKPMWMGMHQAICNVVQLPACLLWCQLLDVCVQLTLKSF